MELLLLLPIVLVLAFFLGRKLWRKIPPKKGEAGKANTWEIGPVILGDNHSVGMPDHPEQAVEGLTFAFPQPTVKDGHVHYVTFVHGPLTGKTRLRLKYRIDAAEGIEFFGRTTVRDDAGKIIDEIAGGPGRITMFVQRKGDDWSGYPDTFRWYKVFTDSGEQTLGSQLLAPGEHELVAELDGHWSGTQTSSSASNPAAFADALANAERVGFVLGGGDGWGHGVWASKPARMFWKMEII